MEVSLIKQGGAFVPADEQSAEAMCSIKAGKALRCKVTQMRNYRFHKKFFALLDIGFDAWEPVDQEYKGLPVQKNRERFRKDCIIAAGYYDAVSNINGDVRAEAKSISFGRMSEEEFSKLYGAVVQVLLTRVLKNYTREDLDSVVDQIVGFC